MTGSRRGFVASLGMAVLVGVSGCLGGRTSEQTETPTSTVSTTAAVDCSDGPPSPTKEAVNAYQNGVMGIGNADTRIGSPDIYDKNSVFGSSSSALAMMYCTGERGACDTEFLDAIESFRAARGQLTNAREDFGESKKITRSCEVSEPELITEQANAGIEKVEKYVEAVDSFLESAKRHVDEDREAFDKGTVFRGGMDTYEEARSMEVMSPGELEDRATVYNG